jgi:DNA end-binding protein Ku
VDLSVGLVTCPVKMIGVIDGHDRKGSMYHRHEDGEYGKVKMPKLCEDCGEVVPAGDIAKGFEENGTMVMLSADEMETVSANTGAGIEVPHFVPADQIDPMLFANENVYRLAPDVKRGRQAWTTYRIIRQKLIDKKLLGVVQYTRWGRNRLGFLDVEPTDDGGVLVIRNIMWPDELRGAEGLLPAGGEDDLDPRLVPVMESVMDSMTTDWNPATYVDVYTQQLTAAIEAKASGGEIATVASESDASINDVADLLAKLEASIATKKADAEVEPKKAAPRKRAPRKAKEAAA